MVSVRKKGLGLIMALALFFAFPSIEVKADDYPRYGPIHCKSPYLYWGEDLNDQLYRNNGMTLTIDETSISYQNVIAWVHIDPGILVHRRIKGFYVLKQTNRITDGFVPVVYQEITSDGATLRNNYMITINGGDDVIGSKMHFQVIGVADDLNHWVYPGCSGPAEFIVAWSARSNEIQFKPLPVIDRDSLSVLNEIKSILYQLLNKMDELTNMLRNKLGDLQEAVEKIYTPSPQTMAEFEAALDQLREKLPMEKFQDTISEMNRQFEDARRRLKQPNSEFTLGGEFEMIPGVPESRVKLIDLTKFREEVRMFREVMQAAIWVWFVTILMTFLTPRPRIG